MTVINRHILDSQLAKRPHILLLSCLFLSVIPLSALPLSAWAASSDRQQPLEVESDRKHTDHLAGTAVYEGKVIIRQGRMLIHADKAILTLREGQLDRAQLEGKPVTY